MALSSKHQAFVDQYLTCFNSTEAYQRVYSPKNRAVSASAGHRLLRNVEIEEAIRTRLQEKAMSADEVLMRLADNARADMGEWLTDDGEIDIAGMKAAQKTKLLRKVKRTRRSGETEQGNTWEETTIEVELHDAQAALVQLGKHHKLFTDQVQQSGEVIVKVQYGDDGTDSTPE